MAILTLHHRRLVALHKASLKTKQRLMKFWWDNRNNSNLVNSFCISIPFYSSYYTLFSQIKFVSVQSSGTCQIIAHYLGKNCLTTKLKQRLQKIWREIKSDKNKFKSYGSFCNGIDIYRSL